MYKHFDIVRSFCIPGARSFLIDLQASIVSPPFRLRCAATSENLRRRSLVSCQYKDGKRQIPAPLDDWDQTLYECTVSQRDKTYTEIEWGTFTRPSALDAKQWRRIVRTITKFRVFLAAHALTRSEQFDYQQALDDDDDEADSLKPDTPVYEFDTLRSLPKIFTWPIFKHPRAKPFVGLTKECIGLTGGTSAPTST
ncbi:hypothetical protein NMY22_g8102 [Coprinellus aureogranulatus]|nr:hypothetical protein NMY22_g8102 [Coprinellus aureogranulatus]